MAEQEEFTCSTCKKEFEEICIFSEYGTEARKQESNLKNTYCNECFDIKANELDT